MRAEYGLMMYVLQDAQIPEIQEALGFSLTRPIRTVEYLLEDRDAEAMALLDDPRLEIATRAISFNPKERDRSRYDREVKQKYVARKTLIREYARRTRLAPDDVELVLNSIGDNRSFLLENLVPVQQMLEYLRRYFAPKATTYCNNP